MRYAPQNRSNPRLPDSLTADLANKHVLLTRGFYTEKGFTRDNAIVALGAIAYAVATMIAGDRGAERREIFNAALKEALHNIEGEWHYDQSKDKKVEQKKRGIAGNNLGHGSGFLSLKERMLRTVREQQRTQDDIRQEPSALLRKQSVQPKSRRGRGNGRAKIRSRRTPSPIR